MALRGTMRPPSDKSISHRALIFAAISAGTSRLENILPSADVRSTAKAIQKIGARLKTEMQDGKPVILVTGIFAGEQADGFQGDAEDAVQERVENSARAATEVGARSDVQDNDTASTKASAKDGALTNSIKNNIHINCGNSGTTTRLLLGVLSGLGIHAYLDGDDSLRRRPMKRVTDPLEQMGAKFKSNNGCLPIEVLPHESTVAKETAKSIANKRAHLKTVSYKSPHASAQVKSAILLAGLFANGTTKVSEPAKSRDHTERMLPAFGANIDCFDLTSCIKGPASLHAHDVDVPADPSSAAFPAVAASCIKNSDIVLEDVLLNPTRIGAFELMRRMGCNVMYEHERMRDGEMIGNIHVRYAKKIQGVEVDAKDIPSMIDEIPILAILASRANGETIFRSCSELRVKESDRLAAIVEAVNALGAYAFIEGDDLHIIGIDGKNSYTNSAAGATGAQNNGTAFKSKLQSVSQKIANKFIKDKSSGNKNSDKALIMKTYHDHRLAMAWSIAGRIYNKNAQLDDEACVNISWPSFYKDMLELEQF